MREMFLKARKLLNDGKKKRSKISTNIKCIAVQRRSSRVRVVNLMNVRLCLHRLNYLMLVLLLLLLLQLHLLLLQLLLLHVV